MSKYCGNCGARMDDSARVCGNCGTPFKDALLQNPHAVPAVQDKKKVKRLVKLFVGLSALILAIIITISAISAFTGYNGLLRKVMTAYENYDINTLVGMSSDIYYYGGDSYAEIYFENAVGYSLDSFESAVGHSFKLSYEINEVYTLPKRNVDTILDGIALLYPDFNLNIIEDVVVADVTVMAKQGKKSTQMNVKITMSKEDGTWKLMYID